MKWTLKCIISAFALLFVSVYQCCYCSLCFCPCHPLLDHDMYSVAWQIEPQKHVNTWKIFQRKVHLIQIYVSNWKIKDECLLDAVAIELQSAPYALINQNHVPSPPPPLEWWRRDNVKNTILQWNAIKLKSVMNVMSVRKKRLQSNTINMLTMYVHAY